MQECILCGNVCSTHTSRNMLINYNCKQCGRFAISQEACEDYFENNRYDTQKKLMISACMRERSELGLGILSMCNSERAERMDESFITVPHVIDYLFPTKFNDRLDRSLRILCKKTSYPGNPMKLDKFDLLPFTFSTNHDEAIFILNELMRDKYINLSGGSENSSVLVSGIGLKYIEALEHEDNRMQSKQAFIAMWFDDDLNELYSEYIKPAIIECGYTPLRIDKLETNGKICDHIISEIKKSHFMVADFTGQRNGVYFEAGFAMGLDIPVIWTCRKDCINDLHFDTRQYSHIDWATPDELKQRLIYRINALIKK